MAKKLGNDYRLWIESATPGTFNQVSGQKGLTVDRQAQTIDLSSKNDFPYAAQAAGARSVSIQLEMIPDLPDANGFTRMETLANATTSTPFNIQVRGNGDSGADPADVVFECSVYATNFPTNFAQNDGVSCSVTLVAAEAPSVDALA